MAMFDRIVELEEKWLKEQSMALEAEAELELANQRIANLEMLMSVDNETIKHLRQKIGDHNIK